MFRHCVVPILILSYLILPRVALAESDQVTQHYQQHVKPILKSRCYSCHGALAQEANLRVDTAANILQGGDGGPAVTPTNLHESPLWSRITATNDDMRMPPEGKPLTDTEIEYLRQWITGGALAPTDEVPETDPRQHWAFQPPSRKPIPIVNILHPTESQSTNPVDAFLQQSRLHHNIVPSHSADKPLLLRRLYLDLIGIPPTYEQQLAFLNDTRSDAYERVVDSLLASPQYGERWARHWMDIWRYSDWYGLGDQLRNSQKHLWHWRDWIIESLNQDLGYNQMITDMLAADELAPTDPSRLRATGFLARNYYLFNRTTWLDTTIEHTAQAFCGLTLNCCKCHDHKYDPLTQRDYYQFRAIFEPHQIRLDSVPGETNLDRDGIPRAFDAHPETPTYVYRKGDEKQPIVDHPLQPGIPAIFLTSAWSVHANELPLEAYWPAARPFVLADHLQSAERAIDEARQQIKPRSADGQPCSSSDLAEKRLLAAELHAVTLRAEFEADRARNIDSPNQAELAATAAQSERQLSVLRAEIALHEAEAALTATPPIPDAQAKVDQARQQLEAAQNGLKNSGTDFTPLIASRKGLEGPDETTASQNKPYSRLTTGRRTALAQWLTNSANPLTARVAVNHIWLRHFGQPLVDPVNDFGRRTPAPIHQDLLDWLAIEWQNQHWSMKWLHRLLVTSDTYRQTGALTDATVRNMESDPANMFYWYRTPARMESQAIRDSLLQLAGLLDPQVGGPSVDPRKDAPPYRRSLYFVHSHDDHHEFLSMFDDADVLQCYRRTESVVPQQALALANSRLALEMAAHITDRLYEQLPQATGLPSDADVIVRAFEALLGRTPSPEELQTCQQSLDDWHVALNEQQHAAVRHQAHVRLIHALLNHNDFITIR